MVDEGEGQIKQIFLTLTLSVVSMSTFIYDAHILLMFHSLTFRSRLWLVLPSKRCQCLIHLTSSLFIYRKRYSSSLLCVFF